MKHRWRRIVVLTASGLLALLVLILGALAWLYTSGRLAMLAQHLLHRLSGQEITFESIAFPSWTTVVVTKVHLQQQLPGWRLVLDCARLEAHYGVVGLFNMQVTRPAPAAAADRFVSQRRTHFCPPGLDHSTPAGAGLTFQTATRTARDSAGPLA